MQSEGRNGNLILTMIMVVMMITMMAKRIPRMYGAVILGR